MINTPQISDLSEAGNGQWNFNLSWTPLVYGSDLPHTYSISVAPSGPCDVTSCDGVTEEHQVLVLNQGVSYTFTVQGDICNDTSRGVESDPLTVTVHGTCCTCTCMCIPMVNVL